MPARGFQPLELEDPFIRPNVEFCLQTDGFHEDCTSTMITPFLAGRFCVNVQTSDNAEAQTGFPGFQRNEEKQKFLQRWLVKILALGVLDFALIPMAYFTSSVYGPIAILPLLVIKGIMWLVGEQLLAEELRREAMSAPAIYQAELRFFARSESPYVGVSGHCACSVKSRFVKSMSNAPEAIDSVMDAAIAGAARKTISANLAAAFSAQWNGKLFGLGGLIAAAGLPGLLSAVVVVSGLVQFIGFVVYAISAICNLSGLMDLEPFYVNVAMLAEASSLKLLNDLACGCFDSLTNVNRVSIFDISDVWKAIIKGLIENTPTIWLQASVMGLLLAFAELDRLSVLITVASILTSMCTMLSPVPSLVRVFTHAQLWGCFLIAALVAIVVFSVMALATTIHVIGICSCPEHNFEISTLGCTNWSLQPDDMP